MLQGYATAIRHHHEWYDGSGLPDHWAGDQIPNESRIIAYCDAFHRLSEETSTVEALDAIERHVGRQFDPAIWPAFRQAIESAGAVQMRKRGARWES